MAQAASKPGALGPGVVLGFLFIGFREHRSDVTVWCVLKMKNDKSQSSPEEGSWRELLDSCAVKRRHMDGRNEPLRRRVSFVTIGLFLYKHSHLKSGTIALWMAMANGNGDVM